MEATIYTRACVWMLVVAMLATLGNPAAAEELKPEIQQMLNAGDTAKAIEQLRAQIGLDNAYHYNYYILGMIYFNQERY
ncbi:MAG TPA: hypothetical protein PKY95_08405, partial [candidate division Zixibacteria bacterium]|nr:hypothetical protein [candidate division Zixibacteria bacterium]